MLSTFTKSYADKTYAHPTMVTHNGTLIAFAMDDTRRIFYKMLNLSDTAIADPRDVNFWQVEPLNKGELRFPSEIAQVGYGVADQVAMPVVKKGRRAPDPSTPAVDDAEKDFFLSTTARLTADAPFQAISDGRFVYVFRQAIAAGHPDMVEVALEAGAGSVPLVDATLLVDRFVLVGTTLQPKMEVRYRRSRSKNNPQSRKDSLGAKDMEEKAFYEPTQELAFVGNLVDGRFSVLLLPTAVAELQRWQIFAHNAKTGLIDSFNVERAADGLFNTRGTHFYTCADHPEVFEQRAGRCAQPSLADPSQPCDKPLIPNVTADGCAESALVFDGADDVVDLGRGVTPGAAFTLEAWIYPAADAEQAVLSGAARSGAPALALAAEGRVRATFGDGQHLYAALTDAGALKPRAWNHVAASYDGSDFVVAVNGAESPATYFVDGVEHVADDLREKRPASAPIRAIGAAASARNGGNPGLAYSGYFAGTIDEIRVWSRARSVDEMRGDMHLRLVGQEPGLAAYWRFDEGAGARVYDQTDGAVAGTLIGEPRWDTSSAPVGEGAGISRGSFRLAEQRADALVDRTIESGMTAILYYQQEKSSAPLGYGQEAKPLKQNARVMLAVATQAAGAADGKHEIAALDFAVSRAGKLAQARDVMVLTTLTNPSVSNETLDETSGLEQRIERLTNEINQLDDDIARLTGESSDLDRIKSDYETSKSELAQAEDKLKNAKADISSYYHSLWNDGKGKYAEAFQSDDWRVKASNNDLNDATDDKLWHFQPSGDGQSYFILNKGKGKYAEAFESDDWRVKVDNADTGKDTDDKRWQLISDANGTYLWNVGKGKYAEAFESDDWRVKVDNADTGKDTADKRWHLAQYADVYPNTSIADAEAALHAAQETFDTKQVAYDAVAIKLEEIEDKRGQRAKRQTELEQAQSDLAAKQKQSPAAVALPMPLLHVDPYGLTIAGAVLGFAWTKATPLLYGSATGKLALYFQGASDQFFVAYYDTLTAKARYPLATVAASEFVICSARSAESELDKLTIAVSDDCVGALAEDFTGQAAIKLDSALERDIAAGAKLLIGKYLLTVSASAAAGADSIAVAVEGSESYAAAAGAPIGLVESGDGETCAVVISGAGITEIWRRVPREPRRFAEVLNGLAGDRAFVGGAVVKGGLVASLEVPGGASRALSRGASLLFGELALKAREDVAEGATSIPIAAPGDSADSPAGALLAAPVEAAPIYSDGVFVGFGAAARATIDALEIPNGASRSVPANSTLLIGQRSLGAPEQTIRVRVREAVKAGATTIAIDPAEVSLVAEQTTVDMVAYDYAANARSSKVPSNLAGGSLLIVANSAGAGSRVKAGQVTVEVATPSCRWVADAPGDALLFDGKQDYAGLPRTALRLDGADDYAQLPAGAPIDPAKGCTIEAWVRSDIANEELLASSPIVDLGNGKDSDNIVLMIENTSGLLLEIYAGEDATTVRAQDVFTTGAWTHIAVSIDAAGKVRMYKNGGLLDLVDMDGEPRGQVGSVDLPAAGVTRSLNYIGKSEQSRSPLLLGRVDELRFWESVRTAEEIGANASRRMSGSETALAACWRFEDGDLRDATKRAANATLYGDPRPAPGWWYNDALPALAAAGDLTLEAWVQPERVDDTARVIQFHQSDSASYALGLRQVPSALQFDGKDDHIVLPAGMQIDLTKGFTIEARVRYEEYKLWSRVVEFGNGPKTNNIILANKQETNALAFSLYDGSQEQAYFAPGALEKNEWVHFAASVDAGGTLRLYKNGVPLKLFKYDAAANADKEVGLEAPLAIPANADGKPAKRDQNYIGRSSWLEDGYFKGAIDEVRLWSRARTAEEIGLSADRRLAGDETGLIACWHFEEAQALDYGPNKLHGVPFDGPQPVAPPRPSTSGGPQPYMSPLSAASAFAIVNGQLVEGKEIVPAGTWSHLAAVFDQSYAVRFNGQDAYLDCGNDTTLDISSDLTIEAFVWLDNLDAPRGILTRGVMDDGSDSDVPYALYVDDDGRLAFAFESAKHENFVFKTDTTLGAKTFHKLAVTRRLVNTTNTKKDGDKVGVENDSYAEIRMYVDGQASKIGQWAMRYNAARARDVMTFDAGDVKESNGKTSTRAEDGTSYQFRGDLPGNSDGALTIGRAYLNDMVVAPFHGAISEVRVWNVARTGAIAADIKGKEKGLVSWWRFEENTGAVAYDSKSGNHARFRGGAQWMKDPNPTGSTLTLYRNGEKLTARASGRALAAAEPQFTLGALANDAARDLYKGQVDEVRIWKTTRTQEQLQDSMFQRLLGERDRLIARYTFGHASGARIKDSGLAGNSLALGPGAGRPTYVLSTAPIGADIPDARNAILGIKTSFHGQIQSPPAVAEYADMQFDADGNLIGVLKRSYAFIQDSKLQLVTGFKVGNLITEWVGQVQRDPQLIGFIEGAPPVPSENLTHSGVVLGEREDYNGATAVEITQASSTTYTYSADKDSGFDMAVEAGLKVGMELSYKAGFGIGAESITDIANVNFKIGPRVSFENSLSWLESASTGSGLATAKVSRMELRGKYENEDEVAYPSLGRRFLPDNVGYALVQSETNDVFALRLQHNNALVAYQMRANPDIEKDWNIISFPINARYTKQGTLDGKVGLAADADYPNATEYSPDSSYFKPIEAYALKNRIRREEAELQTYYDQYDAGAKGRRQDGPNFSNSDLADGHVLAKLPQFREPDDPDQRLKKDEATRALKKRNMVNTYVWTADGGLFAESEETTDVQQESIGGSYAFKGMAGLTVEQDIVPGGIRAFNLELQAMFGGHLNLTVNKSWDSETSFGMNVEVAAEGDLYQRDAKGNVLYDRSDPRNPRVKKEAGKVDAYRFMSFYLEPRSEHFDMFFNKVVDPIWLAQSEDPAAVALREAQSKQTANKPACWRLMHRVTYISRILPPVEVNPSAPVLEKTLRTLDIDSNYELIKKLEPFVKHKTGNATDFYNAVELALETYLPELLPHKAEIKQYIGLYFGVSEDAELGDALDAAGGSGGFSGARKAPVVSIAPVSPVGIPDAARLEATIAGVSEDADDLLTRWSKISGPGDVLFNPESAPATDASFSRPGVYVLQLKATSGGRSASARATVVVGVKRVAADLQALYTFQEGAGATVRDVSGVGAPLDLAIEDLSAVSWAAGRGGLTIAAPTILASAGPATKLIEAVRGSAAARGSNEITIEAWVTPQAGPQGGLARIVTLAGGTAARNVTLGQSAAGYYARLRTSETNLNASDQTLTAGAVTPGDPVQVVFTRDRNGAARMYVDGVEVGGRAVTGDFGNWSSDFVLMLANERAGREAHPWLGELRLVAIYSRALTPQEVRQNYGVAPSVTAAAARATILAPALAQLRGTIAKNRLDGGRAQGAVSAAWSGPAGVVFAAPNDLSTTASFPDRGVYTLRLTADDGALSSFAEVTLTVNKAPEFQVSGKTIATWPDPAQLEIAVANTGLADPSGEVRFEWAQQSGPGTAAIAPVAGKPNAWSVTASASGIYVLRVTADNGYAQTARDVTLIANRKPVVVAGSDQTITLPGAAHLEALVVEDGLPRVPGRMTVEWSVVQGDPKKVTFDDKNADHTIARFSESGSYKLRLTATDGAVTASGDMIITVNSAARVTSGLRALYIFEEGAGDTFYDVSNVGSRDPLHLKIRDASAVRWLPGRNGVALVKPTLIASDGAANKINGSIKDQQELTIEVWLKPANATQDGNAGIVTLTGNGTSASRAALAQSGATYGARLSVDGNNQELVAGSVAVQPTHLVFTRDKGGQVRMYVNGAAQPASSTGNVNLDKWDASDGAAHLVLGNEWNDGHAWQGELYLVAIYNRALDAGEVQKNYAAKA